MPNDIPSSHKDLSAIYESRRKERDAEISLYNQVESAIHGVLPTEYQRLFTPSDVQIQLRTSRAADDSLTKFLAEIPIMPQVAPVGKRQSQSARDKAEVVEKVIHSYHRGGFSENYFDSVRFKLARYSVRFQDALLIAYPDRQKRQVFLEAQKPHHHFPPLGWTPYSLVALDGTLLVYEMPLGEIKRRVATGELGDVRFASNTIQKLNNSYAPNPGFMGRSDADDSVMVKVGVYRSRDAWIVVALGDTDVRLAETNTDDPGHPGVTGVVSFKQLDSDPLFLGQIGVEAGLMKVVNQQIQNTERINKATTIGPPLMGDLVVGGYNEVNMALMQGRSFQAQRLAPDSPGNLTQVMGQFLALAEKFNYSPESSFGAGDAVSGKAIQQLQAGPRTLITNILFAPYKPAFPRIYDDCMDMELNLWGNERKSASGRKGRDGFDIDYTPSVALRGFQGKVSIEDPRAGGYQAFLEALQKKDAGMTSLRAVLEADPDTRDVEARLREIQMEETDKFIEAGFQALGGQDPVLAIKAASEVNRLISEGKTKAQAIQEVIDKGMLTPPQPELPAGAPPELAALMGGGPAGVPPSLESIRGGVGA